jgi:hypothetical protein
MKTRILFDNHTAKLIRDGYCKKHGRNLDEVEDVISHGDIAEYVRLGKQVQRRESTSRFVDRWGATLFWLVVITGFVVWYFYDNHQKTEAEYRSSSNSSKSSIYYSDTCPITTCNDGACSKSTGRGTCSHHGGVRN